MPSEPGGGGPSRAAASTVPDAPPTGSDASGHGAAGPGAAGRDGPGPAALDLVGTVYDIQGFSVQDGPGIRTTVFLKGCPLHCPWCHSPESQRFDIQLSWQSRKCIGLDQCGLCLPVCPRGALSPAAAASSAPATTAAESSLPAEAAAALSPADSGPRLVRVDWDKCDDCGLCAEACPSGALSLWGKEYTVGEVVDRVLRDRPFFEKSGGGATISGGEPFSQPAFTLALLQVLKAEGIHTAVDTTGCAPWSLIEKALPYVDLVLYDLKSMDGASHKAATGVSNELILENARRIAAAGGKMQVRVPVIPRYNDSDENIHELGGFVAELGEPVTTVQILPYHAMGIPKWERIRHRGPVLEAALLSEERIEGIKSILEGYGLLVQVH